MKPKKYKIQIRHKQTPDTIAYSDAKMSFLWVDVSEIKEQGMIDNDGKKYNATMLTVKHGDVWFPVILNKDYQIRIVEE